MLFVIYADIESLIKKIDGCANNPEKSSIKKIGEHILYGYSMWIIWAFDHIENKHNLDSRRDCKKKFCESLREHAKNISDFEEKKNATVSKKILKTTSRCKSMLHLWKKNLKKAC